jgi:hypothetical protein
MRIPLMLAYLDPATGSQWFQILLGGVFGLLALARHYWGAISGFFRSRSR